MKRLYSMSTGCTYFASVHGSDIPSDAVEIPEDLYKTVIGNPRPGMIRAHDEKGLPYLVDAPEEDAHAVERQWRNAELASVEWIRDRHRDEVEINQGTTLDSAKFEELLIYIQQLRDWPQSPKFPEKADRPVKPKWIE